MEYLLKGAIGKELRREKAVKKLVVKKQKTSRARASISLEGRMVAVWVRRMAGLAALAAMFLGTTSATAQDVESEEVSSDFNRELLSVEEKVHTLKERVFRSKATLQLLKEIVVQGSASGARATIWHVNKLGSSYELESLSYYVVGQGKFTKSDPQGGLGQMREFKVFEGAVPPGNHNLTIAMKLRGNGFGVFSYVKNYSFNVQSSTAFVAEEGKSCSVRVVANERKGIGRSFTERPNVTFETRCIRLADTTAGEQ